MGMAVSVRKLKIGGEEGLSGAQVVNYLAERQPAGDYYSEGGSAFMNWLATPLAMAKFGLDDRVFSRAALLDLIEGVQPQTGKVIRHFGSDRTAVGAIDVTLSPAPKSVSILWALGDNALRYQLEVDLRAAVLIAIGRMLDEQLLVRKRVDRKKVVFAKAEDYVGAQVLHSTARLSTEGDGVPDPQLHIHNLLIGAVTPDGELRALESHVIMKYQAELEGEASAVLADRLLERGFELEQRVEQRSNGQPRVAWEVKGVPEEAIRAFSSRTVEIDRLKEQYRKHTGREAKGPGWDSFLISHRGPKSKLSAPELRVEWRAKGAGAGFWLADVRALVRKARARRAAGLRGRAEDSPEAEEFRRRMLAEICRDHAFVTMADVDRLTCQLAGGLMNTVVAGRTVARMFADGELLQTTDDKVTTLEILAYEQRTRDAATRLIDAPVGSAVAEHLVEAELRRREAEGRPFDEYQAAALKLVVSGTRFASITGPAGAGKGATSEAITTLFHSTGRLLRGHGRRVIALAVASRTAQQAGADAHADETMNLKQLEARVARGSLSLGPDDVLLVDEAGLISHQLYAPLTEAAAAGGATVLQVGDDQQLPPVGPGGLWRLLHRQAEAADRAAELRIVHRARSEREAEAWTDLREGRIVRALVWMRDQGRFRMYETRPEMLAGIVEAWWAGDPDGLMMVDTSNEERDEINALAQAKRLEAGQLGREVLTLANGREVRAGDRLLFSGIHKPDWAAGERWKRVENGTPATVVQVDLERATMEVRLHELGRTRRLEVRADAPVELGYARHGYKAQSVTREDADFIISRNTTRNSLYVMGSRARSGARAHTLTSDVQAVTGVDPRHLLKSAGQEQPGRGESAQMQLLDARTVEGGDVEKAAAQLRKAEEVRIREIDSNARSVTKEAVGDRHMKPAGVPVEAVAESWSEREGPWPPRIVQAEDWTTASWEAGPSPERRETLGMARLPLPAREADLLSVRLADGPDVRRGQVVRFRAPEALPGGAGAEMRADDLGVVLGCHRGGITWDYATVELVGGRRIELWQTAHGVEVRHDLAPSVVLQAVPRPDQRDPTSLRVVELQNGTRLMAGDQVRITEATRLDGVGPVDPGTMARVHDVERHRHNRAVLQLEDGRQPTVYSAAPLEIVKPVEEARLGPTGRPSAAWAPDRKVLPARDPVEQAGRRLMEHDEAQRALAHYEAAGRLDYAADPAARAVERLAADPDAVVVVSRQQQERRVRQAIEEHPQLGREGATADRVLRAETAYAERSSRRKVWLSAKSNEALKARVEPGVAPRAYVVGADRLATGQLSKALSVAAESHLVMEAPEAAEKLRIEEQAAAIRAGHDRPSEFERALEAADAAGVRSARVAAQQTPQETSQNMRYRAGAEKQAELARELAYESGREAAGRRAELEAEPREAEMEIER
jgi:conjugative relaxase-like TrwC/TraI family protein